MPEVLASTLSDKRVLGAHGETLGTVYNVTIEPRTGQLRNVLVDPDQTPPPKFQLTRHGHVRIPADSIVGVDEYVVVDPAEND